MLLLIIRHADAEERDPARWPDDTQRPLSDKGRKVHRRVSRALKRLELVPELVLTSPWVRAAQTADILVEELGAILLGGSATSVRIDFPKSGVLGIDLAELTPAAGELRFLLRPKQLG